MCRKEALEIAFGEQTKVAAKQRGRPKGVKKTTKSSARHVAVFLTKTGGGDEDSEDEEEEKERKALEEKLDSDVELLEWL